MNPRTNLNVEPNKNVTVNPMQETKHFHQVGEPVKDLVPIINIPNGPILTSTGGVEIVQSEIIYQDSEITDGSEPIYADIQSKVFETSELGRTQSKESY